MRAFFAISLALMGCGDNLGEGLDPSDSDPTATDGVLDDGVVAKLIPEVCGARAWPEALLQDKDTDLAVVPLADGVAGAAVLSVPRSGGHLHGFLIDGRGLIMGDPGGTKIVSGTFNGLSAAHVDGRIVVGLTDGTNVSVNVLRDDLGDYRELASVAGSFIGDATIMHARGERIATTGGPAGVVMSAFDGMWAPMGDEIIARSVPTSMTSAMYGNDAMVAWSTTDQCHLQRVASNIHSEQSFPCANARLATNYDARAGELVYELEDGIYLSNIRASSHNEIANQKLLVPNGKSPRIAFDGTRYWVSYVNLHGDIVVGYLDDDDTLNSMAVEGTRPLGGAYDLAVINGAVWVYAVDVEEGFNAHRMCLVREY